MFNFQIVGPPSSAIQKLPSASTTRPSESIPQTSLAVVFKLKLLQSKTVSVDATSKAVLPNPVGLIIPEAPDPSGRFIVIVCNTLIDEPTIRIRCIFGT